MTLFGGKIRPLWLLLLKKSPQAPIVMRSIHQSRRVVVDVNGAQAVVHRATMEDKKAILDIDRNIYGGMDYLSHWFDRFYVAPNRRVFVGKIGKDVIFQIQCVLLDNGKTCLYQGGRIKKEYRGMNIFWKLIFAAESMFVEEFPSLKQSVWTMTNKSPALLRDSFWDNKRLQFLRFQTSFVLRDRALLAKSKFNSVGDWKLQFSDLTREELTEMCHACSKFPQLFHSKVMIVFYEPFELMASNVEEIFSKLTYAKRSISTNGSGTGLSFLVETPVAGDKRRRADLDIYSSDTQTVIEHIHFYLNHVIQSAEQYTPLMTITFDKRCDYHQIVAHLNGLTGLEHGPLYSSTEVFLVSVDSENYG